jgi:hypothetical protein
MATELNRIAAIRKACGGRHPDIESKAITEGWDPMRAELEVLRLDRSDLGRGEGCDLLGAQRGNLAGGERLDRPVDLAAQDVFGRRQADGGAAAGTAFAGRPAAAC